MIRPWLKPGPAGCCTLRLTIVEPIDALKFLFFSTDVEKHV
jgi:hypothetical protein